MLLPIGKITYSIFDSNSNSTTPIFGSKALKEAFQEVGYVTWPVFSVAYIIFIIMLIFILFSGIKSKFNNKKNVGYENNKISLGERIIFLKLFTELLNELKSDDIEKNKKAVRNDGFFHGKADLAVFADAEHLDLDRLVLRYKVADFLYKRRGDL